MSMAAAPFDLPAQSALWLQVVDVGVGGKCFLSRGDLLELTA